MTTKFLLILLSITIYNIDMQTSSQGTSVQSVQLVPFELERQLLSSRAVLLKRASQRIPVTAEQLIVGFYRVDLLPVEDTSDAEDTDDANDTDEGQRQVAEIEALKAAYVELSYENGYPTLPAGEPFWHKLDYEPGLAYGAFQIFLDMGDTGARELTELAANEEFRRVCSARIGHEVTQTEALQIVSEYCVLYYWRQRSKAYDLFKEAAYRHLRIKRQMSAEDTHYQLAAGLLKKVEAYLAKDDFENGLTPKTAIEALKALVAIQRVSIGLPAAGPLPSKDSPEVTHFEAILRQLGTAGGSAASNIAPKERSKLLDDMLTDPSVTRQMQELIIRVTTTNFGEASSTPPGRTFDQEEEDGLAEDVSFHKEL